MSHPLVIVTSMEFDYETEFIELIEKAIADLEPELMSVAVAIEKHRIYDRADRLVAYAKSTLAARIDDASELARVGGTSLGKAKEAVATGKALSQSDTLSEALRHGTISLDQATEIAKAEESAPGSAEALVEVARKEPFHILKEKARKAKLEAEQHRGLAERQREARKSRNYSDELGMIHIDLTFEPAVGSPIVARAEADAQRLAREAKQNGTREPFECYLADAYAAMLAGGGKGRAKRPELVVLVDYEVAKRGWTDVREQDSARSRASVRSHPRRRARSPKSPS